MILINGKRLNDAESQIIRMAVDTFRAVMEQGLQEKDPGITGAMTKPYVDALSSVQQLLDMQPSLRVQ